MPVKPILVVDDSELERTIICDLLAGLGYQTLPLASALDVLVLDLEHFSAIFADAVMPRMDGGALLVAVREAMKSPIPFVFVSGVDPQGLLSEAIRYGAEFLPKPITLENIAELTQSLIGSSDVELATPV